MKFLFLMMVLFLSLAVMAQNDTPKLYNPHADAAMDIKLTIKKAAAENKHVLIQAGGNWCSWCLEFARLSKADRQLDSAITNNYVLYHLNFSKENRNDALFAKYGFAQRFGFPVFIILNSKGERLHTQNSEYLEDGKKSYDKKKVLNFLEQWTPGALAPATFGL